MAELIEVPEDAVIYYLEMFGWSVDITDQIMRAFKNGYRQGFNAAQSGRRYECPNCHGLDGLHSGMDVCLPDPPWVSSQSGRTDG